MGAFPPVNWRAIVSAPYGSRASISCNPYFIQSVEDEHHSGGSPPAQVPEGPRDNSPAFQRRVNAQRTESRAVGTPEPYPNTYCGSYSTPCFFKNAMNSSSRLRLR